MAPSFYWWRRGFRVGTSVPVREAVGAGAKEFEEADVRKSTSVCPSLVNETGNGEPSVSMEGLPS